MTPTTADLVSALTDRARGWGARMKEQRKCAAQTKGPKGNNALFRNFRVSVGLTLLT